MGITTSRVILSLKECVSYHTFYVYVILCTATKWQKYNKVFVPYFFSQMIYLHRYLTTISLFLLNLLLTSNDSTKKSQTTDQSCQNLISMNLTKLDKKNYQTIIVTYPKDKNVYHIYRYCHVHKTLKSG